MNQFLTIKDMAHRYNVVDRTIRNWIKQGMPCIKVGNVLRFDIEEVEQWIKGR